MDHFANKAQDNMKDAARAYKNKVNKTHEIFTKSLRMIDG